MNLVKPGRKVKARRLSFFLFLLLILTGFHLAKAPPPAPCKYSVSQSHLLTLTKLIQNQLLHGCSIKYAFMEQQHLILDLLKTHFQYVSSSDNGRYVTELENVIFNIYTQKCIPEINEEREDNPDKFATHYDTSPQESLRKVHCVLSMYMKLMTEKREATDWNCEQEYAVDVDISEYADYDDLHLEGTTYYPPISESFVQASQQPDNQTTTLSPLTAEGPGRPFQPTGTHSTAQAEVWSPSTESIGGHVNTDVSQSSREEGHSAAPSRPLHGPTLDPGPASDLVTKMNNFDKE
ncbi:macrophage colony-stimulating factor 1a isoform X2 [Engraulis encrasicolus]|uniref:macrophage colony-stimulating factor 1a isoform X2 n=1 Tax=Engraulis encrasicolus TaxID=184585 RepID=UPI002FD22B3B